jgi:hypothetical protein
VGKGGLPRKREGDRRRHGAAHWCEPYRCYRCRPGYQRWWRGQE